MAKNAANDLSYYLLTNQSQEEHLAPLRRWKDLKIGLDAADIWVKGLNTEQVQSPEVKTIPRCAVYYASNGKLFPRHSQLPERSLPALLWTPIERALPVQLPAFNHNFFGITGQITMQLQRSEQEQEAIALITDLVLLRDYIETAPAIRLQQLRWALINSDKVLLYGSPQLPLNGEAFWQRGHFLMPAGFDFELSILSGALDRQLNPEGRHWIIWFADNSYCLADRHSLMPLSLESFRAVVTPPQTPSHGVF